MAVKKHSKTQRMVKPEKVLKTNTKKRPKPAPSKKTTRKVVKKAKPETAINKTLKNPIKPAKKTGAGTKSTIVTTMARTHKKLSAREKKIQEIKNKLQMQRNILLAEAEVALNSLPDQTVFPDLGDQASAEIDRNFMLRLRGREQMLLKKIDSAIEKIGNSTFGICEVCGHQIELKRLEARPVTTMCISCKTEQEEEEKLRGH